MTNGGGRGLQLGGAPRYWVTLGDIGPRAMGAPNLTVGGGLCPPGLPSSAAYVYDGLSTATSASKLSISNKVNRIEIVG